MSRLVFGTAALGLPYGLGREGKPSALLSAEAAAELVEAVLARGVDTFDTAPAYGEAEARLGASLGRAGKVWTKLGRHESIGPALADEARASLTSSLARLKRPFVDLLQWHNWTAGLATNQHFRECWRCLEDDPRVGALGASTYGVDDALAAVESGLFRVVQVEWNILNQSVVAAIVEPAKRAGTSLAVRSVFLQGALTDEPRELPAVRALREGVAAATAISRAAGIALQDLAMRSALECDGVSYVLMGIDRIEQIDNAVRVAGLGPLPAETADAVRGLSRANERAFDPRSWVASAK